MSGELSKARITASVRVRASWYGTAKVAPHWRVSTGDYEGAVIYAVTGGTLRIKADDQPPCSLSDGDILLIPQAIRHEVLGLSDLHEHVGVDDILRRADTIANGHIDLSSGKSDYQLWSILNLLETGSHVPALFGIESIVKIGRDDRFDHSRFHAIRSLLDRASAGRVEQTYLANALLAMAVEHALDTRRPRYPIAVERAVSLIHDPARHLDGPGDLAARLGVSQPKLSRHFKQVIGTTLAAYMKEERLQRAALYLRRVPGASLSEVCDHIGLHSQPSFCRDFKRRFRMTPTEFGLVEAERGSHPRSTHTSSPSSFTG